MQGNLWPFSSSYPYSLEGTPKEPNAAHHPLAKDSLENVGCSFHILPNELIKLILGSLSPLERLRTLPTVCKKWHLTSLTSLQQTKDLLHAAVGYPADRLLLINNLLAQLSEHISFSENLGSRLAKIPSKYAIFNIIFDRDSYKAGINTPGKWGNIRQLHRVLFSPMFSNIGRYHFLSFDLAIYQLGLPECALPFYWYKLKLQQTDALLNNSIKRALDFELRAHIQGLSERNVALILPIIKPIQNSPFKLKFLSTPLGLIEHQVSESFKGSSFNLAATKINEITQLTWQVHDLDSSKFKNFSNSRFSFKQAVRWCILSKTVEGIAEHLNECSSSS